MSEFDFLQSVVKEQKYPLVFATVSGAHLYGFPSPDSDFDLRGTHILPPKEVLGLAPGKETIETERIEDGRELDLVTLPELIERKINGKEKGTLDNADLEFYEKEYVKLTEELEKARDKSSLPEIPTAKNQLNDLLIRLRLG